MNVDLFPAGIDDAGELLTLQRAAYATEGLLYGDPSLPALTQSLESLRQELAVSSALKAVIGHRIVGAVRSQVSGETVHIGRLTVAPDLQGHGIGSHLLDAVETAQPEPVRFATLFTGHLSIANIRLYERRGYVETRREPLHEGVELVHLVKKLSAG
jgi:ribosomal protein S18 acetylase RimI-like enzyme